MNAAQSDCCEVRRLLAEQFAIAARLYAETVVHFTMHAEITQQDYERLRKAAEDAQIRAQCAGATFEEHVASHRCGFAIDPIEIRSGGLS